MSTKIRKTELRNLNKHELASLMESFDEKRFRAKQIHQWLWQKKVNAISEMRNLPKSLIEKLEDKYSINKARTATRQESRDRTIKYGFGLMDDAIAEGVLIPSGGRTTACISSQVGCKLGCRFCATGMMKFHRNLFPSEILDQVMVIDEDSWNLYGHKLSNIVFMGMGEPLLNFENVMKSIEILTSEEGLAFSPQRVTLSTVGIIDKIKEMGDRKVRFNLAVSLHTANNDKRSQLMPVNKTNPLNDLIKALKYFHHKTQTRVTYEYLLLKGINDSAEDAKQLADFCKIIPSKVNLIEYNPIEAGDFKKTDEATRDAFIQLLEERKVVVNLRRSRGKDIDAACGQLAIKNG